MFLDFDLRHLRAVIVLAEELNFTRAAKILRITQPALTKQIRTLEEQSGVRLFARQKGCPVDLTVAGRVFVEEARSALSHAERAIQFSRAAQQNHEEFLTIGFSHYADVAWISALLTIRLPLYPRLRVRMITGSVMELVRGVLAGGMNMALVTAPPEDSNLTAVPFSRAPLCVAFQESHHCAGKETITLRDFADDDWILFARDVHPMIHETILRTAQREGLKPQLAHEVMTANQAMHLVSAHGGIALFPHLPAMRVHEGRAIVMPLPDAALWFDTCLIMQAQENSRLANEFGRVFLRRIAPRLMPTQIELPLSA